jgi:3-methyladenine DNA glycosylase Tag
VSEDSSQKCRNKAKIESSITEAYILEEVSNFTEKYYTKNLPSVYNPPPRYNASENELNLSLFQGQLGSPSTSTIKQLKNEEWRSIMLYVLTNLVEVQPFIG